MVDVLNLVEQIRLKDEFIDAGVYSVKEYKINLEDKAKFRDGRLEEFEKL